MKLDIEIERTMSGTVESITCYCGECGELIDNPNDLSECPNCGAEIEEYVPSESEMEEDLRDAEWAADFNYKHHLWR